MESNSGTWGALSAAGPTYNPEPNGDTGDAPSQLEPGQVRAIDFADQQPQSTDTAARLLDQFTQPGGSPGSAPEAPPARASTRKRKATTSAAPKAAKKRSSPTSHAKVQDEAQSELPTPPATQSESQQSPATDPPLSAAAAKRAANQAKRKQKATGRRSILSAETVREDDDGEPGSAAAVVAETASDQAPPMTVDSLESAVQATAPKRKRKAPTAKEKRDREAAENGTEPQAQPRKKRKSKTAADAGEGSNVRSATVEIANSNATGEDGQQAGNGAQAPKPKPKPRKPPGRPRRKNTMREQMAEDDGEEGAGAVDENGQPIDRAAIAARPKRKPRKPRRTNTMREQRQEGSGEGQENEENQEAAANDSDSDAGEMDPDTVTMWELANGAQFGKRSKAEIELRKIDWPAEKAKRNLAAAKIAAGYNDEMEMSFEQFVADQDDKRKNRWKYREEEIRAREQAVLGRLEGGEEGEEADDVKGKQKKAKTKKGKDGKAKKGTKKKKKDSDDADGEADEGEQNEEGQNGENEGEEGENGEEGNEEEGEDNENEEQGEETENAPLAQRSDMAQMRVVNGQIIMDDQELLIDRQAQAEDLMGDVDDALQVEDQDYTNFVNQASFANQNKRDPKDRVPAYKHKSDPWTLEETDRFYDALRMFGTDFMMIAEMFPPKTRRQIKLKFCREERLDLQRINKALMGEKTTTIDLDFYAKETDQDRRNFDAYQGLDDFNAKMKIEMADLEAQMRRQVEEDQEDERQRALLRENQAEAKERKKEEQRRKKELRRANKGKIVGTGTLGGPVDEDEEENVQPTTETNEDAETGAEDANGGAVQETGLAAADEEALVTPEPDEAGEGEETNVDEETYDEDEDDNASPPVSDYGGDDYDDDEYYGRGGDREARGHDEGAFYD